MHDRILLYTLAAAIMPLDFIVHAFSDTQDQNILENARNLIATFSSNPHWVNVHVKLPPVRSAPSEISPSTPGPNPAYIQEAFNTVPSTKISLSTKTPFYPSLNLGGRRLETAMTSSAWLTWTNSSQPI